ncbi:MAG: dipeptidase [Bacteroidetes bacterium]|nr:dipeptidase [Bacteroidota bacterium]
MKKNILFLASIAIGFASCNTSPKFNSIEEKAAYIHNKVFTVDSHTDTPMSFSSESFDFSKDNSANRRSSVDIPRMEKGGLDGVFLAAFIGQGPRNPEAHLKAKERVDKIIKSIHTEAEKNKDKAGIALNSKQAYKLEKEGKRALFIGIENGYPLGNDIALVKIYHDMGARYITLVHTKNNDICDSSGDTTEYHGLSAFGEEVVKEMNRTGVMIDISHASDESFYDVIALTKAPIIASHSCARALCENDRNMTDDMLKKLAENGGVIQMCILSAYIKTPEPQPARDSARSAMREKFKNYEDLDEAQKAERRKEWYAIDSIYPEKLAYVSDVVDHIDHVVAIAGIDHVGIGTDFDGGGGITDCIDVSQMGNITLELVKRGYTENDIRKIWGANLMRVLEKVERLAEK